MRKDRCDEEKIIKPSTLIAGILLVIFIIGIWAAGIRERNADLETKENVEEDIQEYDITTTGNGEIDPENVESNETGANVDVAVLQEEAGISHGIDVSKWQGKIDWKKVKESGIEFAFIRIGYRGEDGIIYKDDNADYNIQQAQKADVLVGVYFFSTAINEEEAKEEAQWTKQAIAGYSISYPVVYDCEGFQQSNSRMNSLTSEERTNNAIQFMDVVSNAGYEAMFYSSLSDAQNTSAWNISAIVKNYKIWIASYPAITYPEVEKPDYSRECSAWQYTNKGTVNGISDNVDLVVCYFTREKAEPKDASKTPNVAQAPLTEEEKKYTSVNESVTAKIETNLRRKATTKSDVVKLLKNGEVVTRIGVGTNGWSKIEYDGQILYAISSYLTTDITAKEEPKEEADIVEGKTFIQCNDTVTAKEYVNLRKLPSTSSEIIGTLESGTFLKRTATSTAGWSRLDYNGQVVYAVTSYLSNEVVEVEKVDPYYDTEGYKIVDEQVTAKSETNLRTAPSTDSSEVVYTLKNGEYVKRIGVHGNGWSKIEYEGQILYAVSSYLSY